MKLIHKDIDKNNFGSVTLIADGPEDLWHAYNLISTDDYLRSTTIRRVNTETTTGSTNTTRVHTTLTICVKSVHFDTQAGVLSLKGTNVEENPYVKMGAFHTIDLEVNRKFTITKREWDSVALDRVEEACDPGQNADLAAVLMQEGLAHVCLVLSSMTTVKAKIDTHIARKRKGMNSNYDKSLDKFFERIVQAIVTHVNFEVVKAIIIASPGFLKDEFSQYMHEYAVKNNIRVLLDNKSKFLLTHSSSGFKHSLTEILHDPALINRLNDTKAISEVKALDSFYVMLKNDPNKAFYGLKHVETANEAEAIDTLLIADSLFRSHDLYLRKRYVKLVDSVKANNGSVKIFSTMHISGEQLLQLSGVAALLRFPMPDIEDQPTTDENDKEANDLTSKTSDLNLTENNANASAIKKLDQNDTLAISIISNDTKITSLKNQDTEIKNNKYQHTDTKKLNKGNKLSKSNVLAGYTSKAFSKKNLNNYNYEDFDEYGGYEDNDDYEDYDDYY